MAKKWTIPRRNKEKQEKLVKNGDGRYEETEMTKQDMTLKIVRCSYKTGKLGKSIV
jgi:hypothetical protein